MPLKRTKVGPRKYGVKSLPVASSPIEDKRLIIEHIKHEVKKIFLYADFYETNREVNNSLVKESIAHIENYCHSCRERELKMELEDKIINKTMVIPTFLREKGNCELTRKLLNNLKETVDNFK